jgi:hypothetical protein
MAAWQIIFFSAKDFALGVVFLYERTPINRPFMKKILCLAAGIIALNAVTAFSQSSTTTQLILNAGQTGNNQSQLAKFNLDFPGGTAAELVKAIEKATGKPLNVIIASDEKSTKAKLPPVKVTDMDVARLFKALEEDKYAGHNGAELVKHTAFYTTDGNPSDNSLWKFSYFEKPSTLTAFSLDFPGGTPAQFVKAIEKATGKPLNAIIPDADADTKLPSLKMDNVDVDRLFRALEQASIKQVAVITGSSGFGGGNKSYSTFVTSYGFKTEGQPTDNSVWYFHADKPSLPPMNQKSCQFYSLALYLDRGFTVDDITTAIQTGWKMSGETSTPELNYHKETRLLMAYGEPDKLKTIDDVLKTLPQTIYDMPTVAGQIKKLQEQVAELKQKVAPAPALGDVPEPAEKPAK